MEVSPAQSARTVSTLGSRRLMETKRRRGPLLSPRFPLARAILAHRALARGLPRPQVSDHRLARDRTLTGDDERGDAVG